MKILKEDLTIFDINAHSLRGNNFYKRVLEFCNKVLPLERHRIQKPEQYKCLLCNGRKGVLFLEWKENYQLFQCKSCGVISPNISVNKARVHKEETYANEIYQEKFIKGIHVQHEYRKKIFGAERYRYVVKRLRLDPKKIKILDVGCGTGFFLSYLKDKGIQSKGLEINPIAVKYCKELGLDVESMDIGKEACEEYDIITMFDVIEHLADPKSVLENVNKKLKKNGFVIIYTTNVHSVSYELMGCKQNTLVPFEHLFFLTDNLFHTWQRKLV